MSPQRSNHFFAIFRLLLNCSLKGKLGDDRVELEGFEGILAPSLGANHFYVGINTERGSKFPLIDSYSLRFDDCEVRCCCSQLHSPKH